ncbi:esterase-like activity of phytase family protein [Corynebacterium heidelbergense]|uniref:Phytase-like domain-containing protein n=1 Tax=Corynebacterium heidelbergense TaxID=2055947 RepID=A0A364VAI4_9CORY|nr:esterase-like activity of phytase family protein [Corynebacterium heidelbergense]RAV33683.1 hypothetical protein CWC39_07215 [Corynebacterium heidelbergense]WCZ37109.1 hypothetical protein CHEID_07890 [Corynebacterium heidelbergense]
MTHPEQPCAVSAPRRAHVGRRSLPRLARSAGISAALAVGLTAGGALAAVPAAWAAPASSVDTFSLLSSGLPGIGPVIPAPGTLGPQPPVPGAARAQLIDTYDLATAERDKGSAAPGGDVPFGGISGLDRVTDDVYLGLSDDRAEKGPVRAYPMELPRDKAGHTASARIGKPLLLTDQEGKPYAKGSVDPESIRVTPEGSIVWTSEGDADHGIAPAITVADGSGRAQRQFEIPDYHRPPASDKAPGTGAAMGIQNNKAYEGLTITGAGDAARAAVLTEDPLKQDKRNRLTFYDLETGRPTAEYAYQLDPDDPGADQRGATEILAESESSFLVLERNYVKGQGTRGKLYRISTSGATDVLGTATLSGQEKPVSKETLLDFSPNGENPDNIEGLAWGPTLQDGRRTVLVSTDNNFSDSQRSLIHTIALG